MAKEIKETYCIYCKYWAKTEYNYLRGNCGNERALDEVGTPEFLPHVDYGCKYFKEKPVNVNKSHALGDIEDMFNGVLCGITFIVHYEGDKIIGYEKKVLKINK